MARTDAVETPTATIPSGEGHPPNPVFRRPKPADALNLAHAAFLDEARVEMGTLATQLGIAQPTLYRWVGTREELLDKVIGRLTDEFVAITMAEAQGDGDERVLDFVRRQMSATAGFQPGLTFISREPQLALRLVLGRDRPPITAPPARCAQS